MRRSFCPFSFELFLMTVSAWLPFRKYSYLSAVSSFSGKQRESQSLPSIVTVKSEGSFASYTSTLSGFVSQRPLFEQEVPQKSLYVRVSENSSGVSSFAMQYSLQSRRAPQEFMWWSVLQQRGVLLEASSFITSLVSMKLKFLFASVSFFIVSKSSSSQQSLWNFGSLSSRMYPVLGTTRSVQLMSFLSANVRRLLMFFFAKSSLYFIGAAMRQPSLPV